MTNSISENSSVLFGPEPPPGTRLGQYILVEKIASGGMGQVWKAQHETNGKFYALKLLPPMIAAHPDAWDQVLANFHLVEGLSHPYICPVKTLERDQKYGPFLVMGFIDGVTLTRYRRGRTFTAEQVAVLLKPVAEALDYAHSMGVIHRDIKHDNIMVVLGEDKETIVATHVIDFGLAAEVRTTITQFSQQTAPIAGTLRYMAPEIWRGRPAVSQTDQYALAVIAYELLSGHYPVDGVDRGIMREAVLNEPADPITGIAEGHNQCLSKGLSKKATDRFQTCNNFIAGLVGNESATSCAPDSEALEIAETFEFEFESGDGFGPNRILDSKYLPTWFSEAEAGSATCQFVVGVILCEGIGTDERFEDGVKWLSRAANDGHVAAMAYLGVCLWRRNRGPRSERQGRPLLERAAEKLPFAAYWMGRSLEQDAESLEETKEALGWHLKAIELGSERAKFHAGRLILEHDLHREPEPNVQTAIDWVAELAEAGLPAAQSFLGFAHYHGKYGLEKSVSKAVKFCKPAAEDGDDDARCFMAARYFKGEGVAKNPDEAIRLLRAAAEDGHPYAKFYLGQELIVGEHVAPSPKEGIALLEELARTGNVNVLKKLVNVFNSGVYISRDAERAFHWARKAAERGDAECQYFVGRCYERGDGVSESRRQAILWLKKSAEADDLDAIRNLARVLWNDGEAGESDIEDAIHWAGEFNKRSFRIISDASANGQKEISELLTEISKKVIDAYRFDLMDKVTKAMFATGL